LGVKIVSSQPSLQSSHLFSEEWMDLSIHRRLKMEKKETLTKTLAIVGTLLVWFPLLAPVILTVIFYFNRRMLRFDYLIPAELFPIGLLGGIALVWAAHRAGAWQRLIDWGLGITVGSLVFGQALAVLTGLATGEMEPAGFWFVILIASLVVYWLAMIATGVGGVLLLKQVFKTSHLTAQEDS
jgi:hypothetical protein